MTIKTKILITSILILGISAGCSSVKSTDILNAVIPASNFDRVELTYGARQRQKLDVYIPKATPLKTPIIFVYGGAWRTGNKDDFKFIGHALSDLGHPVIIPDYSPFPEVKFPEHNNEIADAIAYIDKNSPSILNKSLDSYILMGHSAGAHTVALLATDRSYLQARNVKAQLKGFIGMAGPYDLNLKNPEVAPVFENATRQQSNPTLNVHNQMPASLLIHGLDDERVLPFHTQRFEQALLKQNIKVTTHLYKGVNHTKVIGSLAAPLRFLNDSFKDIKAYLASIE